MRMWKVALVVCFLLVGQAFGQASDNSCGGLFKPAAWEIGPEIFHHKYTEPGLMKNTGMMYGFYWSYTDRQWLDPSSQDEDESLAEKPAQWMIATDGSFAYGTVDYDGHLMNGTPYNAKNDDNWLFEARLLFGPDFPHENRMDTIYTGLGFRYLDNDSSDDPTGYVRESHYLYMPVGITTMGKLNDSGWSLGATAEFDAFLYGVQTSHLHGAYGDIHNQQHEGYGVRGSIKLGKKDGDHNLIIEPFVRYWKIQQSEESEGFVEPSNDTVEFGARLIWRF